MQGRSIALRSFPERSQKTKPTITSGVGEWPLCTPVVRGEALLLAEVDTEHPLHELAQGASTHGPRILRSIWVAKIQLVIGVCSEPEGSDPCTSTPVADQTSL